MGYPAWFLLLDLKAQRKQLARWRYHRRYQRIRLGDRWQTIWAYEVMTR